MDWHYSIIIFHSGLDGGYIADIPDLQMCSAFGETPEEALKEVQIAKSSKQRGKTVGQFPKRPSALKLNDPMRITTDGLRKLKKIRATRNLPS